MARAVSRGADDGARDAALRVLLRVEEGAWSDRILASEESRLGVRRERGFLHLLVLTTLRWQGALDLVLDPLVRRGLASLDPNVRAILRLGLAQACLLDKEAHVAVSTSVDLARRAARPGASGLVNAVLRRALQSAPGDLDPVDTLPAWLRRRWTQNFGVDRCRALAAASVRPAQPFVVALDADESTALEKELREEGLELDPSRRVDHSWRVARGVPQATRAFAEGRLLLVDEGAALVAALARPARAGAIADLAAAPGGKATLLARAAQGPLVALEPVASRARDLAAALELRASGCRWALLRADARRPPLAEGCFEAVLLDAPCSGSGTIRRRPEKRHRLREEDIAGASRLQRTLLAAAAPLVAPGGSLTYAVCSLEPEEGVQVIEDFLRGHPDFTTRDPGEILGERVEGLVQAGPTRLETRPEEEESEGFVAVRLERR